MSVFTTYVTCLWSCDWWRKSTAEAVSSLSFYIFRFFPSPASRIYWSLLQQLSFALPRPTLLVYVSSQWRWFMIGRLFSVVSQRAPSLLHRVSLMMKPQVVFVLGGPGAGKGTQCSNIVEVIMGDDELQNNENWRVLHSKCSHNGVRSIC